MTQEEQGKKSLAAMVGALSPFKKEILWAVLWILIGGPWILIVLIYAGPRLGVIPLMCLGEDCPQIWSFAMSKPFWGRFLFLSFFICAPIYPVVFGISKWLRPEPTS